MWWEAEGSGPPVRLSRTQFPFMCSHMLSHLYYSPFRLLGNIDSGAGKIFQPNTSRLIWADGVGFFFFFNVISIRFAVLPDKTGVQGTERRLTSTSGRDGAAPASVFIYFYIPVHVDGDEPELFQTAGQRVFLLVTDFAFFSPRK